MSRVSVGVSGTFEHAPTPPTLQVRNGFLCDAGVVRCTRRCFKTTQLDGVDSGHYARLRIWGLSNVVLRYDARHAAYSCSGEGVTSCLASSTNIEMR